MKNLKFGDSLLKDKTYLVWIEVNVKHSYEGKYETEFVGNLTLTDDKILNYELLETICSSIKDGWKSFESFNIVKFADITDTLKEVNKLKLDCDNFDWNHRDYDEFDKLSDEMYELEDTITLNVLGAINIDKII